MKMEKFFAPSYARLRPFRENKPGQAFPLYPHLVEKLLAAHAKPDSPPDSTVAHVLATCSGYGYADGDLVATMMARLGLGENSCLTLSETVDAMLICSTAHLVQSRCGRVIILCYRGTEPVNLISWLTDLDVHPEKVSLVPGQSPVMVHAGFHRNVRSTRFEVAQALRVALSGKSLLDGHDLAHPLEALYVTGHSQGGALAALFALMTLTNPDYRPIADAIRAVYTFGQPMIACPPLPSVCASSGPLGQMTFRYIYRKDVVPALPPTASGDFQHFGREYRFEGDGAGEAEWRPQSSAEDQVTSVLEIPLAVSAFFSDQLKWFRRASLRYSIDDHIPTHYIDALRPKDQLSEFGD